MISFFVFFPQECLYFMGLISENKVGQIAKVLDKDNGDVGKFLNRILGLSVQRQNLVRFFRPETIYHVFINVCFHELLSLYIKQQRAKWHFPLLSLLPSYQWNILLYSIQCVSNKKVLSGFFVSLRFNVKLGITSLLVYQTTLSECFIMLVL